MKFSAMKFSEKLRMQLGAFAAIAAALLVTLGCSNAANKGAIPPTQKIEKVKDSDEHAVFNQQVDILLVVDDSGSMQSHQTNLSKNIKLFTAELAKTQFLDYHVGVVTTSMDGLDPNNHSPWGGGAPCDDVTRGNARACGDGRLVRFKTKTPFIDRNTPNGLSILETNVLVGTEGSGEEHSFDPIYAALTSPMENTVNVGFHRPDATLAVIFVTDSEDQSNHMSAKALFDFLVQLKAGKTDKVLAYGALVPSNVSDPACPRDDGYTTPKKIEEFIALTKGLEYNICDSDYGKKLAVIAKDVVQKVGKVMYLSRPPVPETITVTYGTQTIPNDADYGWTYDPVRNALIFGEKLKYSTQPPGTQMEVNFTAGSY